MLGISNVTLLLTLNPSDIDQVTFSGTEDTFTAVFYESECSDVATEGQLLNYTRSLDVTEQQYRIDEFYFVKNSLLRSSLTAPEIQNSSSCVARIYIFNDHSNYFQFISTGQVRKAITSYCLTPPKALNFTIPESPVEKDHGQYYFVGLKSFASMTINYTATGDLLKYNTTGLSPKRCRFPTTDCSISLHTTSGDVCILAHLLEMNKFVPLNYVTQSQRRDKQATVVWVTWTVSAVIIICLTIFVVYLTK